MGITLPPAQSTAGPAQGQMNPAAGAGPGGRALPPPGGSSPMGGSYGNIFSPGAIGSIGGEADAIMRMLMQGPSQGQQNMVQQLINAQFQPAAQQLQQQGQRLSAGLSGSAAARGLGKSSIGLGQQGLLGQALMQQLGGLQSGLQAQGLQHLLQVPGQNAALAAQLFGDVEGFRLGRRNLREQERARKASSKGSGLGALAGGLAGSFIPGLGTALGTAAGGGIESLFRSWG